MNQGRSMRAIYAMTNAWRGTTSARLLFIVTGALVGLMGCASTGGTATHLTEGQRVSLEGRVASIDLSPMAYDGDALVVVTSSSQGIVTVHVPARRHLCKATGLEALEVLKPNDKIRVKGVATGPDQVNVCIDPSDLLERPS